MTVSMEQIKRIREKTGSGMMDVRNALEQAGGDEAKAMDILRQKGMATAEKKSARATAEGAVAALIAPDMRSGALVELNCETDFAAKNERFQALVNGTAQQVLAHNPANVEAALALPHPTEANLTLKSLLTDTISAIQENMTLRRMVRYELPAGTPGVLASYIHMGGKMGVLVELTASADAAAQNPALAQLAKDVALQLAGSGADFVTMADIPAEEIDRETQIEMGKEDLASKPEAIRANIVKGRVEKLMAQRVLMLQPFLKDPSKQMQQVFDEASKALGAEIKISRFTRFVLGEGMDQPAEADACSLVGV
ncbi:MAG: translation elongation factor Ts [Vampirovibrionales bacterium]|nr:translation elongation factor Ts [Vampirovibrionales bacterium]